MLQCNIYSSVKYIHAFIPPQDPKLLLCPLALTCQANRRYKNGNAKFEKKARQK